MERWERERILGEWGVRDGSVRDVAERQALERALEGAPFAGQPLRPRRRNFHTDAAAYVASLGGPLPYMRRLRAIHDETGAHETELARAWGELALRCGGDAAVFERRWHRMAEGWNFVAVNELIERHNRNYPAEARLPMDPRTGDFALVNGKPYRRRPLDADWVLERFPPVVGAALAAGAEAA
jgi:hypothetical protein